MLLHLRPSRACVPLLIRAASPSHSPLPRATPSPRRGRLHELRPPSCALSRAPTPVPHAGRAVGAAGRLRPGRPRAPPPAAAAAGVPPWSEAAFTAVTAYALLLHAAWALRLPWSSALRRRAAPPAGAATVTSAQLRYVLRHPLLPLLPLVAAYAALLVASWQPDTLSLMLPGSLSAGLAGTPPSPSPAPLPPGGGGVSAARAWLPSLQFVPTMGSVSQLLSRPATAASCWAHLLTVNGFAAAACAADATRRRLPAAHSVVLILLAGPAGLACHLLTVAIVGAARGAARRRAARAAARAG